MVQLVSPLDFSATKAKPEKRFPYKLYDMLEWVEQQELTDVVSWLHHNGAFKIHDRDRFMSHVSKHFFKATKLRSIHRQLGVWGFKRIRSGDDMDAWRHEHFVRGRPEGLAQMSRTRIKCRARPTVPDPDVPNLYRMPTVPVNPRAPEREDAGRHTSVDVERTELPSVIPTAPDPDVPDFYRVPTVHMNPRVAERDDASGNTPVYVEREKLPSVIPPAFVIVARSSGPHTPHHGGHFEHELSHDEGDVPDSMILSTPSFVSRSSVSRSSTEFMIDELFEDDEDLKQLHNDERENLKSMVPPTLKPGVASQSANYVEEPSTEFKSEHHEDLKHMFSDDEFEKPSAVSLPIPKPIVASQSSTRHFGHMFSNDVGESISSAWGHSEGFGHTFSHKHCSKKLNLYEQSPPE